MIGWTAVETAQWDIGGRGQRHGHLGHDWALRRSAGRRRRGGRGGRDGRVGRTWGVLEGARLRLGQGESGQSVRGHGGEGGREGGVRDRRRGQVALGGLGALTLKEGGRREGGKSAAVVAHEGGPAGGSEEHQPSIS